jgi:2-polyprenyl-3-methyl-5-hydroxy-6-metoxy-1,4-benzoquinol methylase
MMAESNDDTRAKLAANKRNWDARAPIHVSSRFYGIGDRDPMSWFAPFEWRELGDLDGREVVHLQCHVGVETMALALKGARTTGLDFSGVSVQEAQRVTRQAGLTIEFLHANVYDAVEALGAERFDIAYTGKGALCYLPDLTAWAQKVWHLLKPGGFLYLNRPGMSGDSTPWEGWSHVRWFVEEVSAGAACACSSDGRRDQ